MTLDPGWFYSALAQTSAAIVGLMGAILGSRLLEHVTAMREEAGTLLRDAGLAQSMLQDRGNYAERIQRFLRDERERNAAFDGGKEEREITDVYEWGRHGGLAQSRVVRVAEYDAEIRERLERLERALPAYRPCRGEINTHDLRDKARQLSDYLDTLTPAERGHAGEPDRLRDIADRVDRLRTKLLPPTLAVLFVALVWIAATGIIWPLAALPGFDSADIRATIFSKAAMLAALVVGLAVIAGYFGRILTELVTIRRLQWPTWFLFGPPT